MIHYDTEEITCPYCGYVHQESYEISPDDEYIGLMDCKGCSKPFYAHRNIEVTYDTDPATFGTCRKCGKENVVIEDKRIYAQAKLHVEEYCISCIDNTVIEFYVTMQDIIDLKED